MTVACAIIAGGRSSRMGSAEKAFQRIGGRTILDRIISRLRPQVDALAINANGDVSRFAATGLAVFADRQEVGTPLAGLHASLVWAREARHVKLLTVPSDTPFLPPDLVERLRAPSIAASGGEQHYLVGLWPTVLADEVERAIMDDGFLRVRDFAAHCAAEVVEWPTVPYDPFYNVNTPADLVEAERLAAEFGL